MKLTVNEIKNKLEYLLKMISQVKKALVYISYLTQNDASLHVGTERRLHNHPCQVFAQV